MELSCFEKMNKIHKLRKRKLKYQKSEMKEETLKLMTQK